MQRRRFRYVIEVIIHVLFWTGVFYALKAVTTSSYNMMIRRSDTDTQYVNVSILFPYRWIVLGILMLLFYGNSLWLFKRVNRYKSSVRRVLMLAGWFIALFAMNYLVIRWQIGPVKPRSSTSITRVAIHMKDGHNEPGPITIPGPFSPAFEGPREGDDWLRMQFVMALVFLSVEAVAIAQFYIRESIRNDLRRGQAEAQQLSTEIKFLRSQVNPHFLFNTLNNLYSMAQRKGHEDLADGISKLSGMMRYMIYESNTETVSLQREIVYLEDTIALHKLRYAGSEVVVCFRHPPAAETVGTTIAPMLFVSFLENAFKHGVSIGCQSRIDLAITIEGQLLLFTCENPDHSMIEHLEKTGIGLDNVRRRLELLYPGRHSLKTGSEHGNYLVNLQIDLA